uniref:Mediator of RNA polymerase II transcription subunit 8 n=1 Tax=Oryza rufipogon TaxID=4529 RepID=A0A0E0NWP6_ORYRU
MDAAALGAAAGAPNPAAPVGGDQQPRTERLSAGVQQQLNLEGMRARAVGLYKAISRILEDFDAIARANPNASPKWQDVLGQFSMVSMELFNIVEDIKKVSKVFVVYPRNVNAENAAILPVMLSSKLLPEMEAEEATKRDNLLSGITNLTVSGQIEKLKTRIDMIGSACETAEKVIAESRKNYGLGARQGANLGPTLDKAQAAKIQEQEGLLRAADCVYRETKGRCVYPKNTSTFVPNVVNAQGNPMQVSGGQLLGRPAPSPGATGTPNFENVSTPPMPYANSPRSGTNMMNTPSPQQHLTAQQHRQKLMQTSQQQQLHAQQQLRPSAAGMLAQSAIPQLQDLQGQSQQKLQVPGQQQMQYNQALSQQYQNRQMQAGRMQPGMSQSQLNQGNQLRSHISQFTGAANSAMFTAAQASSNSQMMANIPGSMQSQSLLPQMQGLNQYSLTGGHPQRSHPSQMLTDQMFGMGGANSTSMMGMQQQQQFNMQANAQNLQQGMTGLQNQTQNPNFPQQRQQNQQ